MCDLADQLGAQLNTAEKAEIAAQEILEKIEESRKAKQDAESVKTRIDATLNTLKETLTAQEKASEEYQKDFEKMQAAKGFTETEESFWLY